MQGIIIHSKRYSHVTIIIIGLTTTARPTTCTTSSGITSIRNNNTATSITTTLFRKTNTITTITNVAIFYFNYAYN